MWTKLMTSIVTNDSYILYWAIFTLIVWLFSLFVARQTQSRVGQWQKRRNPSFSRYLGSTLTVANSVFVTLITIFPLLGMYGTVSALLNVDLSAGNLENARVNFFAALTSTAWGIVFSIAFKLLNALTTHYVETQIADAAAVSQDLEQVRNGR